MKNNLRKFVGWCNSPVKSKKGILVWLLIAFISGMMMTVVTMYQPEQQLPPTTAYLTFRLMLLDGGLREVSIFSFLDGKREIEVRDLRKCRWAKIGNCQMTRYQTNKAGEFEQRESYEFNHGVKLGVGKIVQVGEKEGYIEKSSYGVGNPIPYAITTYKAEIPYKGKDPRIFEEQRRLSQLLLEIHEPS